MFTAALFVTETGSGWMDKQISVYPNFSNNEKRTIDTHHVVDKRYYRGEWRKLEHKRIYIPWFHVHKILLNCFGFFVMSDKKQMCGAWSREWRREELQTDKRELLGKDRNLCPPDCDDVIKLYTLHTCNLLYINYTSVMLIFFFKV